MQIEKSYSSTLNFPGQDAHSPRESSAATTDVAFFTSLLDPFAMKAATAAKESGSTLLTGASKQLKDSENRLARALKSSSNGMDIDSLREYPRALSHTVLTTQLLTKSLGKTTQCIDKISNLQ